MTKRAGVRGAAAEVAQGKDERIFKGIKVTQANNIPRMAKLSLNSPAKLRVNATGVAILQKVRLLPAAPGAPHPTCG
jgi:hypothetical protein